MLERGRGRYFAWMPHDDTFPAGWYEGLCAHLDAWPDTLLAFDSNGVTGHPDHVRATEAAVRAAALGPFDDAASSRTHKAHRGFAFGRSR